MFVAKVVLDDGEVDGGECFEDDWMGEKVNDQGSGGKRWWDKKTDRLTTRSRRKT